eukprot:274597-Hanusia_phi.AAC.1
MENEAKKGEDGKYWKTRKGGEKDVRGRREVGRVKRRGIGSAGYGNRKSRVGRSRKELGRRSKGERDSGRSTLRRGGRRARGGRGQPIL